MSGPTLSVLSLFAGIGGIELGLERAGMTTVGQVELDDYCQRVLARHWPEVPRHDDVVTAPDWWLSEPRPTVDVVCGGFPCQPFSKAGRQLGMADERWGWPWMADVIRAVRPRYVLVENVAALVRDAGAFGCVLADLHALGFDAEWATLRAADFGAPHNRERVYVLAHRSREQHGEGHHLGAGRVGRSPIAARGLSGLDASALRRTSRAWLGSEPQLDRLAHGIPRRVERLRVAGNAVVPAVAQHIGRLIVEDAAWRQEAAA